MRGGFGVIFCVDVACAICFGGGGEVGEVCGVERRDYWLVDVGGDGWGGGLYEFVGFDVVFGVFAITHCTAERTFRVCFANRAWEAICFIFFGFLFKTFEIFDLIVHI